MNKTNGAYVVSWDFSNGIDKGVLIVGYQDKKKTNIVNAFQGKEAYDIYEKLSKVNGKQ